MRLLATSAVLLLAGVNAIFEKQAQTLEYKKLDVPYNNTLGCGGCIRGGYTYCIDSSYPN